MANKFKSILSDESNNVNLEGNLNAQGYARVNNIVTGDGTPDTTPAGTAFANTIKSHSNMDRVVNFEGYNNNVSTWYTSGNTALGAIDQNATRMSFWQNHGTGWANQFNIYKGYQESANQLRAPIYYDSNDTGYYADLTGTGTSINLAGRITGNTQQKRVKYSVWSGDTYGIGMKNMIDYGHIGTNEYAMTFQMNDDSSRGFWWGDSGHTDDQGAMSLTTNGKLVVATSLSVGEGQSVTSPNAATLYVDGASTFEGDVTIGSGTSENRALNLQTNAEKDSIINFKESAATYGFSIGYYGVANDFIIKRHDNSTSGTDVFTLYRENNNATFAGNIYAPIFYDSDNTGYYVNPAASSKLVYLGLAADPNTSGGYRLNMGGAIDMNSNDIDYVNQLHFNDNIRFYDEGNDSYLNFKYGDSNAGGIKFYNGGGTRKGYVYADDSGFGLLDNDGNWAVRTQLGTDPLELRCDNNTEFFVYTTYTYSPGSSRAPIFYDSDNTNYYVNPAGTSRLGFGIFDGYDGASGNNARLSTGISLGRFSSEYAYMEIASSNNSGGWIDFNQADGTDYLGRIRYYNSGAYMSLYAAATEQFRVYSTYTISTTSSRAPIFYDSDDTGRYVNPAGTSSFGTIHMNNNNLTNVNHITINDPGGGEGIEWLNGNGWKIYESPDDLSNASGNLQFVTTSTRRFTIDTSGNSYSIASSRAPIFYDSNDTNYYTNPNGTSVMSALTLASTFTQNGGDFITHGTQTGDLNTFWQLGGTGKNRGIATGRFQSGASNSFTSADNANWIMNIYSHAGSGGNYPYGIQLAGTNTSDRNLMMRYVSNGTFGSWGRVFHENSSDIKAPIFYDSNDTNYYCDPNGQSRLSTLNLGSSPTSGVTAGYIAQIRGSVHMTNDDINYVRQLHFNDNVRFYDDGNDSYLNYKYGDTNNGGIRFRNGSDTIKGYIYADNSGFGLLDNDGAWALRTQLGTDPLELRCDNNTEFYVYTSYTYSPGSSRAPIFYDSNDTGYYLDPASTTRLNSLDIWSGGVTHWYRSGGNAHQRADARLDGSDQARLHWYGRNDSAATKNFKHAWYDGADYVNVTAASDFIYFDRTSGTVSVQADGSFRAPIFYDSDNTAYKFDGAGTTNANQLTATRMGVNLGGSSTTRYGISLYDGYAAGEPTYGIMFTGTSGLGTYGSVTSDWATYFTMNDNDARGWIFRKVGSGNTSSISAGGVATFGSSTRSPIFYDNVDTNYYVDPANTGTAVYVKGDVVAYGASDERLKDNIKPIENALDKVCSLSGNTFEWNKISHRPTGKKDIGVIAQEVEKVFPEIVDTRDSGYKAVDYEKLSAVLIEAVKELKTEIEELKDKCNGCTC